MYSAWYLESVQKDLAIVHGKNFGELLLTKQMARKILLDLMASLLANCASFAKVFYLQYFPMYSTSNDMACSLLLYLIKLMFSVVAELKAKAAKIELDQELTSQEEVNIRQL